MAFMLTITISPIIKGFVIMKLWLWFIVPTFEANHLRIVEAIGIMLFVNYLRPKISKYTDPDNLWSELLKDTGYMIFQAGFALSIGWIVKNFM